MLLMLPYHTQEASTNWVQETTFKVGGAEGDGRAVKSTGCYFRGPEFSFQHPHEVAHNHS